MSRIAGSRGRVRGPLAFRMQTLSAAIPLEQLGRDLRFEATSTKAVSVSPAPFANIGGRSHRGSCGGKQWQSQVGATLFTRNQKR